MLVLIENDKVVKYPYTLTDLRISNPNVSFPSNLKEDTMLEFGVHYVHPSPKPVYDSTSEVLEEISPAFNNELNQWIQRWSVREFNDDEILQKANEIRDQRNILLSQSDWTQTLDAPVNQELWKIYRQALRDITQQPGFPLFVTWPVL